MHEYPRNPTFDSVSERRVNALAGFGFAQRQREFLATVMVHAGCFLERQYCAFTGTARGQNSREFVARLVTRGFARAIVPGPVRRGRLYHVHHKPLYAAIGLPDDRNRRLHSIGRMVERVMILDAVLSDRRCWWLSPEADKRSFFDARDTGLRPDEYPHISFGSGRHRTIRCFPDKLPIGRGGSRQRGIKRREEVNGLRVVGTGDGDDRLLSVVEAAALLGISRTKTYELASRGQIPVVRIGKAVRIPRHKLIEWIDAHTQMAA